MHRWKRVRQRPQPGGRAALDRRNLSGRAQMPPGRGCLAVRGDKQNLDEVLVGNNPGAGKSRGGGGSSILSACETERTTMKTTVFFLNRSRFRNQARSIDVDLLHRFGCTPIITGSSGVDDRCFTISSSVAVSTTHFLNKLNNIGQLPNGVLLVTLDVTSLYTTIPHKDGIQACSDFLDRRANPTIKTTRLCDLIELILTNNTFTFNGQHYSQVNGTSMGTKMAPSYGNIFMGKFEQEALASAPQSPLIWWRYIDDIFLLWTHGEDKLNNFITYLNNLYPIIKFTSSFSYNEISFLDVKVILLNGRLETDLYVKPTDKHQYLLKSSCHPSHAKQSILFSMTLRPRRTCNVQQVSSSIHAQVHSQHTL